MFSFTIFTTAADVWVAPAMASTLLSGWGDEMMNILKRLRLQPITAREKIPAGLKWTIPKNQTLKSPQMPSQVL
jgi:hypothetical protein